VTNRENGRQQLPLGRRVVATGLGVVSPLGANLEVHWRRLLAGASGIRRLEGEVAEILPVRLHAPVTGFHADAHIHNRMLRKLLLPSATFAVAAAGQALVDAGLAGDEPRLQTSGLYFGSVAYEVPGRTFAAALRASFGPDRRFDFSRFATLGMEQVDPLLIVKGLPNAAPCGIAIEHGIRGINASFTSGPTSGLQAAVAASDAIREGIVDIALVGGSDSLLLPEHFVAHSVDGLLRAGDARPWVGARPFDQQCDGYVLGEGAAACVLEAEEHALARGARIYGSLAGAAETTWTSGAVDDRGCSLEAAARGALGARTIGAVPVDAVFAMGLGTKVSDRRELEACSRLFPEHGAVPVTAATGAIGMTGAASGAFSLVHALRAIYGGAIPPATGCEEVDPRFRIVVAGETRLASTAMVWATDGSRNVALLLERRS
jgi:3-oxoacyl-[acyl-carrier-protein] synthase II